MVYAFIVDDHASAMVSRAEVRQELDERLRKVREGEPIDGPDDDWSMSGVGGPINIDETRRQNSMDKAMRANMDAFAEMERMGRL